jgi:hypothetical protein
MVAVEGIAVLVFLGLFVWLGSLGARTLAQVLRGDLVTLDLRQEAERRRN